MKALRNYLDKIKPNFEEGGKLAMFRSVFDGFETFLFVPNETSKTGVHIHDCIDSKRAMTVVIIALLPALLFGMYNVGYQHNLAVGADPGFLMTFIFGFLAVLPKIIVSYVVGLGIEFAVAQVKKEEIQEGFLVSGILIPMIVPVDTPLWMIAVATAFAVIFAKEVFGGTGYNIFNVALVTRAFLFFAYPAAMSGDQVFVRTADTFGIGAGQVVDGFSGATPLGQVAIAGKEMIGSFQAVDVLGNPISTWDAFIGLIPGSIGETSVLAILIGAVILLVTGIASWKTMVSVFVGGANERGQKLFSTAYGGWMAHYYRGLLFVKCFPDIRPDEVPPGQGEVEIFVAPKGRYLELENHGKYVELQPGESLMYRQKWFLKDVSDKKQSDWMDNLKRQMNEPKVHG